MKKLASWLNILVATIALSLAGAGSAQATAVLYAADGEGGAAGNLYILDATTGSPISTIGAIGFAITGLAFHPTTGALYGVTSARGGGGQLVSINTSTGAGTLIGGGNTGVLADIAFDASGTLYGWTEGGGDDLVTVDLGTGIATIVGDFGAFTRGSGLTFRQGTLWFAGRADPGNGSILDTVSTATGASTGTVGLSGFAFAGRLQAMATDDLDIMFALEGGSGLPSRLLTVGTDGTVTLVGSTLGDLDAIAFQITATPEPGALALLALGLGALGFSRRRAS